MSIVANQQRTFLALLAPLRVHWHRDRNLPARIHSALASHRRFGSRDRRLYRELIYTTLRYLNWIEPLLDQQPDLAVRLVAWLAADAPATAKFRDALVSDWPPCPASIAAKTDFVCATLGTPVPPPLPDWFRGHCPAAFAPPHLDALLARAPLWLRLQTEDASVVTREFDQLGWRHRYSPLLPTAVQLLDEVDVTQTSAHANGFVEIQDLGSQLLLESAGIAPGGRWLDACAGAGGKTLQLAQLLRPGGHIDAHDIRPAALDELAVRARRARLLLLNDAGSTAAAQDRRDAATLRIVHAPVESYDGVLVDAPCSGSGTWRRAPHLKWTTTPAQIADAAARQRDLLARFSRHVRPGGRLLYATCSLSRYENENVVAAFLDAHGDFVIDPPARSFGAAASPFGLTFLPALHHTDGFFVASLRRS